MAANKRTILLHHLRELTEAGPNPLLTLDEDIDAIFGLVYDPAIALAFQPGLADQGG
jgi:hypothetical protein